MKNIKHFALVLVLILMSASLLAQGTIEQWTEEDGVLGLGYPVPIPVDTPLPFDGFRAYNGLHTRHQDLTMTTDIVHGSIVGQTHHDRNIWAYRIGDADGITRDGLPEPAMMTVGGIHAREWQTPEVVTGIMELFADKAGDHHFYDFLLDNANIVLLPVYNVDGFNQTQRYPTENWYQTNPSDVPNDPRPSPRDGRMRRKNMLDADEILTTKEDHLFGIDLNRNNPPFWSNDLNRSSSDSQSIVYHGTGPHSEPEAQALIATTELGPVDQLRAFTDVHSFSQVFYWSRTTNQRLSNNVINLLNFMGNHNAALPNGSLYLFNNNPNSGIDYGFGMTNEWITHSLGIPSWGVEVEPTNVNSGFPGNPPGCGANYGGLARNCHDGFILPESQIRRVREELARSFAAVYYLQSGPPSIAAVRFVDTATQAVVFEAEWDPVDENSRELYVNQVQPLALDQEYTFWVAYDRPMRWREDGEVVTFPGQPGSTLDFTAGLLIDGVQLGFTPTNDRWLNTPGDAPNGYRYYQDDAFAIEFILPGHQANLNLISGTNEATLQNLVTNMAGQRLDGDPSTTISFANGGWSGYENNAGVEGDVGGIDDNIKVLVSRDPQAAPFLVEPGTSAIWFDVSHDGEGFIVEILEDNRVVMYWFTYDENGEQAWYIAVGEVRGNRMIFPEVIKTSGGVFGPDFDPTTVVSTVEGSAVFLMDACDHGTMVYQFAERKGRFDVARISSVLGAQCGNTDPQNVTEQSRQSGTWINVDQSGHGFVVEMLSTGDVVVYWFTYDQNGHQAWFFGVGEIIDDEIVISEVLQTRGPVFGPDYDPADLEFIHWGELRLRLSCGSGSVSWDGRPAGFGVGDLDLGKLSSLAGLACP